MIAAKDRKKPRQTEVRATREEKEERGRTMGAELLSLPKRCKLGVRDGQRNHERDESRETKLT